MTKLAKLIGWSGAMRYWLSQLWPGRHPQAPALPHTNQPATPLAETELGIAQVIGSQLLNIYGYQQQGLQDLLDDESCWWLEFSNGWWVTVVSAIAPAWVSPQFLLRFRVLRSEQLPVDPNGIQAKTLIKNPAHLQAALGLVCLAELPWVGNELEMKELRLGLGADGVVTTVLRLGYLDAWQGASGPGLGVRVSH
jgi:hypothetical protein